MMKKAKTRKEAVEHLLNGGIMVAVGVPDGITPKEQQLDFYQCKQVANAAREVEANRIVDILMLLNAAGEANMYMATTETVQIPDDPNPFELYETKDGWQDASAEIKAAINQKLKEGVTEFNQMFEAIQPTLYRLREFGVYDTASREAVWKYLQQRMK